MEDADVPSLEPMMQPGEVALLKRMLGKSRSYVEFGMGGSTLLAVRSPVQRIWSVESDPEWIRLVRRHPEIVSAEQVGRLTIVPIDLGPIETRGIPEDRTPKPEWAEYYEKVWSTMDGVNPDLVLVDGRFRVACTLTTLLHVDRSTSILIHDFFNRPAYHQVLKFTEWQKSAKTMVLLKKKKRFKESKFERVLDQHREDLY